MFAKKCRDKVVVFCGLRFVAFCDFGLALVTKGVVVSVCGVVRMAESLGLEGVVTTVTTFLFNKRGGVYIGQ